MSNDTTRAALAEILGALRLLVRDYHIVYDVGDLEMQPALWQADRAIAAAEAALAEPVGEPVARVAEVHMSRYTVEWTNGPLPEGTPLYAAPAPVAPAMPEGWVPLTIEWDRAYPEEVAFGPKHMMNRLGKWLDAHFANKLSFDKLQADAARLDWLDMQAQTFGNPENECPDALRWVIEGETFNVRHAIDADMARAAKRASDAIAATGQEGGSA